MTSLLVGGTDGVEGEGLARAGGTDEHRRPVGAGTDRADRGSLVLPERWSTPDRSVDGAVAYGWPGVAGVVGGVEEAAFPAEMCRRRPTLDLGVVDGHDMPGRQHPSSHPLDRGHGGAVTQPGRDGLNELWTGEGRVGEGQLGLEELRGPFVGVDEPIVHDRVAVGPGNPFGQPPANLE